MLSRVADSLYWMSRYMERSDGILRMLKTNYAYSQDDGTDFSWRAVLTILSESSEEQINRISQNNREVLKYLITDKSNRNSVINIVSNARENARAVQDNVTKELWQCLNDYYHLIRSNDLENAIQYDDPISVIDELIKRGLYYYGTTEITLARDGGYYFINLEERRKSTPYEVAQYFCHYVFENFKYIKGITSVETTVDEIWKLKSGVCQDFAHILLVMLRRMGIPARYVSGYICPNQNGMRGEGATHAWVETFIPDYGWLGLDPTNNCIVQSNHVRLAVGRNFVDVSPVKGTYKGTAHHKLEVKVIISYENDPFPQENESKEAFIVNPQFEGNSYQRFKEMQEMQQQ